MDEYLIVPKRVMDSTQASAPSHPAESKDVLSLSGLIDSICKRSDLGEWQKASMLRNTLERYMALTNTEKHLDMSRSNPQEARQPAEEYSPEMIAKTIVTPTPPLIRKTKRSAESDKDSKVRRNGPDVLIPAPSIERPAVVEADLMDTARVAQVEPLPSPKKKKTPEGRAPVTQADNMELGDNPVTENFTESVATRGQKRDRGVPADELSRAHDKRRNSTRKRAAPAPRILYKKKKEQSGGLKQRWIFLQ